MTENKETCATCLPSEAPFDYINTPGAKSARASGLINLTELPEGKKGIVERISETDHDLAHLVKIGQNPVFEKGLEVTVLAKSPNNGPVIIRVGEELYDVCNDVASVVWVQPI